MSTKEYKTFILYSSYITTLKLTIVLTFKMLDYNKYIIKRTDSVFFRAYLIKSESENLKHTT